MNFVPLPSLIKEGSGLPANWQAGVVILFNHHLEPIFIGSLLLHKEERGNSFFILKIFF
jgi:hypothetical protein